MTTYIPTRQTLTVLALTLAVVGAAAIGTAAYAHDQGGKRMGKFHRFEYRADIHNAIENHDFETWKELTQGKAIQDVVLDEDDFARLVEAHDLMESGEFDQAQEILQDLGIDKPFHGGHKHKHGLGMRVFLELNDEEATKLEEARQLFQSGDTDGAKDLIEEVRDSFKERNISN